MHDHFKFSNSSADNTAFNSSYKVLNVTDVFIVSRNDISWLFVILCTLNLEFTAVTNVQNVCLQLDTHSYPLQKKLCNAMEVVSVHVLR